MYLEIQRMEYLRNVLSDLIDSVNPIDGKPFRSEIVEIIKPLNLSFIELEDILTTLINNPMLYKKSQVTKKKPFHIRDNELQNIEVMQESISISKLTFNINKLIDQSSMHKLKATQLTSGLVSLGFLEIVADEETDQPYKIATEIGIELGITTLLKTNALGIPYSLNLYNYGAQTYILKNLMNIIYS